jgi:hypothetical protein
MTNLPSDPHQHDAPSAAVIAFAQGVGIDLVNGQHDTVTAEAARRAGLELLVFPRWKLAEINAHGEAMRQLADEEQRDLERIDQVIAAMREHGAEVTRDVPEPVLCGIFDCPPEGLDVAMEATLSGKWWYQ